MRLGKGKEGTNAWHGCRRTCKFQNLDCCFSPPSSSSYTRKGQPLLRAHEIRRKNIRDKRLDESNVKYLRATHITRRPSGCIPKPASTTSEASIAPSNHEHHRTEHVTVKNVLKVDTTEPQAHAPRMDSAKPRTNQQRAAGDRYREGLEEGGGYWAWTWRLGRVDRGADGGGSGVLV